MLQMQKVKRQGPPGQTTTTGTTTGTTSSTTPGLPPPTFPPFPPNRPTTTSTSTTTSTTTGTDTTDTTTSSSSTTSTTSSSTTSTTSSTSSTTSSTSSNVVTQTSITTAVTTVPPTQASSTVSSVITAPPSGNANNLSSGSKPFLKNKAAVAGVFTVVGIAALIILVIIATNVIRRRRARKFDDEVATAAAAAYADADIGASWQEEDDRWGNAPPSTRAYTSSSGANTSGSFGAHGGPPLPVGYAGGQQGYYDHPQAAYQDQGMDEFPQRNQMGYANAGHDPFGDAGHMGGGVPVGAAFIPGIAGIGAGKTGQEMRYRGPSMSPVSNPGNVPGVYELGRVDDGMQYDSGRYPVPPARSRSMNNGNGGMPHGRSPSNSSSGHSHSLIGSTWTPAPGRYNSPPPPPPKLPQMQEHEDDPYDGVTPDSERSEPHLSRHGHGGEDDGGFGEVEDAPRMLRVANA